ncbi:predicted protein [Chaetomium globosum CBS 148.51]|uniref:Uncharacterized protein n=1 Tax=Chaetomium globosum (strain ATCC 6205 / CBS 148.51 / DSM 1962 / NBRC 6347 / NRRL 1970) TaxID=306901 RepID=Q2GYL8_CHAGB|nr:uncharacterized protein CHGG_06936 [Chaetomium globosum CBS 148.51]EAQ85683.1 predicted protein [Chaetomium globosum CBS 148.51]
MSKKTVHRVFTMDKKDSRQTFLFGFGMGMDPCIIVLDKEGNFVGFGFLGYVDFATDAWYEYTIQKSEGRALTLLRQIRQTLSGDDDPEQRMVPRRLWAKILTAKLASKEFPRLEPPYILPSFRSLEPPQQHNPVGPSPKPGERARP